MPCHRGKPALLSPAARAGDEPSSLDLAVYPTPTGDEGDRPDRSTPYPVDAAQAEATAAARTVVEATLDGPDAAVAQSRVGDPTEQIVAEAGRREASHLVLGGRKQTSVGKVLFGSVTQSVLLETGRPVLASMVDG